jgi:hypothetical protein
MSGVAGRLDGDVRATTEVEQPVLPPTIVAAEEGSKGKRERDEKDGRPGKRRRVEPTAVPKA